MMMIAGPPARHTCLVTEVTCLLVDNRHAVIGCTSSVVLTRCVSSFPAASGRGLEGSPCLPALAPKSSTSQSTCSIACEGPNDKPRSLGKAVNDIVRAVLWR